jgi:cytochrome c biogenesis protein CcmG/thiol:disulfide interchange protein DsbE
VSARGTLERVSGTGTALDQPAAPSGPIRHLRWLVPLAVALLAFIVFAAVEASHDSSAMSGSTTIQMAGFYVPSQMTPVSFSLPVLQAAASGSPADGSTVTMSSLIGKPVVLNIWSSSCTICRAETPAMESMARRAGSTVRFVGVDTLDQRATALAFLHRYDVSYLQLFDSSEHVGSGYDIRGFPVTIFVSGHGKVMGEYLGGLSTKTLSHYLETLFGVRVAAS